MTVIARKAHGRHIFTAGFKHQQVARVQRGEITAAELSRELAVQRPPRARGGKPEISQTCKIQHPARSPPGA